MPLPFVADVIFNGVVIAPVAGVLLKVFAFVLSIWFLKLYFGGAKNQSDRLMASKVIIITGGTSGVGAAVVKDLAARNAQIILLTHYAPSDLFLVDYIDRLRSSTGNELIFAEHVDLASLHSIRQFATTWINNAPPRRLDMIILCADTLIPRLGISTKTTDQLDPVWGINYLANFHLLSILSPAIRVQPPDRDVRIIFATCASYVGGHLQCIKDSLSPLPKSRRYETSKLANMVFAQAFQKHLNEYVRPDKQANNARVIVVDPGFTSTPGMRRWLTMGSLWGLLIYLFTLPIWWLLLKSPLQGAQGFLKAAMDADLGRGSGGRFIKECRITPYMKEDIMSEMAQKTLWAFSERQIQRLERAGASQRALAVHGVTNKDDTNDKSDVRQARRTMDTDCKGSQKFA